MVFKKKKDTHHPVIELAKKSLPFVAAGGVGYYLGRKSVPFQDKEKKLGTDSRLNSRNDVGSHTCQEHKKVRKPSTKANSPSDMPAEKLDLSLLCPIADVENIDNLFSLSNINDLILDADFFWFGRESIFAKIIDELPGLRKITSREDLDQKREGYVLISIEYHGSKEKIQRTLSYIETVLADDSNKKQVSYYAFPKDFKLASLKESGFVSNFEIDRR